MSTVPVCPVCGSACATCQAKLKTRTRMGAVTDMEMKWHPIRSVADNPKESGKYLVTAKTWRGELVVEIWNFILLRFWKRWFG